MKNILYFWLGFKNSFKNDIKKEYPINELWSIKHKLENKFQELDYETYQQIRKKIQTLY